MSRTAPRKTRAKTEPVNPESSTLAQVLPTPPSPAIADSPLSSPDAISGAFSPERAARTSGMPKIFEGYQKRERVAKAPPAPRISDKTGQVLQPRWKRHEDSKMRRTVAKILLLKRAGHKTSVVAKRLNTTPANVRHYLYIAGKNGWLDEERLALTDPDEHMTFGVERKIVRNIDASLDGAVLLDQQFQMTIEAAKGRGVFKHHAQVRNESAEAPMQMSINVLMPPGLSTSVRDEKAIGGTPAYIEAEVTNVPRAIQPGYAGDEVHEAAIPAGVD